MKTKTERPETVALKEQSRGERALYLGKLSNDDLVPGGDITLGESKKLWEEMKAEDQKGRLERRARVIAENNQPLDEANDIEFDRRTFATPVVPGVLVTTELPAPTVASQITSNLLPELPSVEELRKKEVAELITLAGIRGVEVKANVDDKDTLIAKLTGTYTEPVKDDLTGKNRGELEEIAAKEGLDGADKALYPNVQTLAEAIRAKRAQDGI